jgi:hypothetical protein
MVIPKKIKVGGHTITILFKDIEECGLYDDEKGTITIRKKMSKTLQESTLIHEIMHAMNSTLSETREGHTLQDSLAEQLYQVLSENKLLK